MCISNVLSEKEMKEHLAPLPETVVAWKVLKKQWDGALKGAIRGFIYKMGINTVKAGRTTDSKGFHCFARRHSARKEAWYETQYLKSVVVRKVLIKKKDIKVVGDTEGQLTYITSSLKLLPASADR